MTAPLNKLLLLKHINFHENLFILPFYIRRCTSVMILGTCVALLGCDNSPQSISPNTDNLQSNTSNNSNIDVEHSSEPPESEVFQSSTHTTPIDINWSRIDSGVVPLDVSDYDYPFAIDSAPVQAHAKYHDISPIEAQHSLTVGNASNEPLPALLDQLGDSYLSHSLVADKEVKLVVRTTPNVAASSFDYVIKDDFAKGLVLKIVIEPVSDESVVTNPQL